jgi:hypothetical protein
VEVLREREPSIDHVLPVIGCTMCVERACLEYSIERTRFPHASVSRFIMNGKFKVSWLQPSWVITVAIPMQHRWLERRN